MYAFTEELRQAWRQLFEHFFELSDTRKQVELRFEHSPALLRDPALWFGHTCGYPLMTRLLEHVRPFCVPLFDVPGCDGKLYSSRFIVAADSEIDSIAASRGRVAAINGADSNSGMNVLRHAVAALADGKPFFDRVITTGRHVDSLRAVADGAADIAAIDCVSYQLIADSEPELCAGVRVIGDSVKTCGLPLVMPLGAIGDCDTALLTAQLNRALERCDDAARRRLYLGGFAEVSLDDYGSILEVEKYAVERGYPRLA
jgi:ABC-type phosphate/phosphonate transport system substrate-binding protein